jgi:glycerophosphoryl diester phosphodiesterase
MSFLTALRVRATFVPHFTAAAGLLLATAALAQSAPDAFTYTVRTGVATAAPVASEARTMTGFTGTLAVNVSGAGSPQYKIGSGAFTSAPGTISAGQTLSVRHTSASTPSTETVSTVTVGTYSTQFKSITGTTDRTPDAFDFGTKLNTPPSTFVESEPRQLTGFTTGVPIVAGAGAQYRIGAGSWTNAGGTLQPGQVLQIRHLTSAAELAYTRTSLTVGGVQGFFTTRNGSDVNQAPTADAGADQVVDENAAVTLAGSGSDAEGPVSYSWQQVAGPDVTLANAAGATPGFTAPDVDADTVLGFELTVTDAAGATASDRVDVLVADTRVVSIAGATVGEDAGSIEFTVTVTPAARAPITVDFASADGTALDGSDYAGGSGTLTIPAGGETALLVFPVTNDALDEVDETFTVGLGNAAGAAIGEGLATGTIEDDDVPAGPTFQVGTGEANHNPTTRTCIGGGSTTCGRDADPADPEWIRDDLISKATAITGTNGQTFIVVTTTNIGYFLAYKAEQSGLNGIYDVRLRIARATGVPSTNVTVVSDHSHNGPDTIGIWGGVSAEYMKITADAVVEAAVEAYQSRREAVIRVAAINQNGDRVPGVPGLDSSYDLPPGNDLARGNPYNEFRLMTADDARTGARILTFVNYAPHATVTNGDDGGHRLTGDWAAWMPQEAERIYGGMGLATVGALGSTDWNKSGDRDGKEAEARARLRTLMAQASARLTAVQGSEVRVESTFIREELMQPALLLNYKPGHDRNDPAVPTDGYDVRIDRSTTPPFMTGTVLGTYIAAARIGDVMFSMLPGEPFGEMNHALVDEGRVQGPRVHFLLGGANDFFGYMVKNQDTYEQTLTTGAMYLPGCPEEDVARQVGLRDENEGACSDHWTLMVSPTFGSHIVCTLQDSADRLGFATANRDAECPVFTALDGLGGPPESGSLVAGASQDARAAAIDQARALAEQCRTTAAPAALCDALAAGASQAQTYLGVGAEPPAAPTGQARAGVAIKDASWHLGASAGQFSATGVGIARDRGYDPYGHSVRKVGSDTLGTRITTRALVVEGANGRRIAIASNDLYLPNDLLHRRTAQLLAEHDALAQLQGGVVTGITDANLATTSSHSHTSPFYSTPGWGTWIFQDVVDLRFYEYMARQMADAVIEAASTLRPVRMGGATVRSNDVQAHTYGPKNVADGTPAGQPRDYTTQAVTVVSFDDISTGAPKPLANWVVFGVHPEWVWGEEIVNGDITHAVMRMLDRETGAVTVWSQRETGSSGPHKDARVHDPQERREFQESNFAGYDRAARYLTDAIKRALGQLATNQPERPDQFAPYQTGFDVASVSQRFAPPLTRPYPGVANCNTDPLFEGHVGLPIVPEPPECGYETDAATEPVFGALPVNPAAVIAQQLKDAGVPVPTSYGISSFTGVQETMAVHLQAFKLGTIAATLSPNEQFTSQALNLESRLDKVADNVWHGFDWACVAQLRGQYPADPAGSKEAAHCARQNARYPEVGVSIPGSVNAPEFPRARAQIHNDASGWELDPAYAAQSGDTSGAATLGGEAEPQDLAQIKGNFTHEEFTAHGYDLVVAVGMANDYWGYMAEYREFRAHSDPYRKGLNALGPHGADFVATRLARLAANLNGANAALPLNPLDTVYQAEAARADAFARGMGELARAYTTAYDATLPPDGGAPGIVTQPAATVKRFSAATLEFVGGSNYTDMPAVRVERLVSGTPADGVWETWGTQEGEVQLQLQFLPSALAQEGSSPLGDATFALPDPQALALWRAGQFEWKWTASFEAFVSELDNLGGRPGVTPAGTYRFVVDGRHRGLLAFPNATPYHLESQPFAVVPWNGITVEDLRVESDGRVTFQVGPVNTFTTFKSGAGDGTTTRSPGYTVGPIDYPDSYAGGLAWIRNERQLFAGDQQYCGRCTFRPWADSAQLAQVEIVVTVVRADGSTYTRWAMPQGGRYVVATPIEQGERAYVEAGAIVDENGERNGTRSAEVVRGAAPADADGDGVPDGADQCPGEAGPASNNGCPVVPPADADGDGVPDASDQCPNVAGPADNDGCPVETSAGFPLCEPLSGENYCVSDLDEFGLPGSTIQAAVDTLYDTLMGGGGGGETPPLLDTLAAALAQLVANLSATLADFAAQTTARVEAIAADPATAPAAADPLAAQVLDSAGVISTGNPWVRRRPLNISHRGGEQDWPENTMFAYAESIREAGSDMIEMDIYETADGELVVIHDETVDRTTNGSGSVSSFTLAQLRQLDAAHWFAQDGAVRRGTTSGRPDHEYVYRGIATGQKAVPASLAALGYGPQDFRIPTLREIFENARFAGVFINVELKPDPDSTGQYEAKLAAMIREYGRQDDVIVASFLDHNLALFKANAPEIATSVPTGQAGVDKGAGSFPAYDGNGAPEGAAHPGLGATAAHKAYQVPMDFSGLEVITAEYVADAHARGMAVHAWTINDRADMVQLLNWCVDGIMSDRPLLLEEVLQGDEWSCPLDAPAATGLSHFIGSLHEHSGFSDGEIATTPADYFDAGIFHGLDFVASSEHSDNAMAPVTANTDCLSADFAACVQASPDGVQKWGATATIADAKNTPGQFSAIRGFEWTSDRFGHINVFFSQHDLNAKTSTGYSTSMEDFWRWLALPASHLGGADGLAVFNHPGREDQVHAGSPVGDPAYAWNDLAYRPEHDGRVVGIEMFGKSGDYYDGDNNAPAGGWYAHALGKGWHVAPVGAEDEHGTSWARPERAKTVMLARENSRAALRGAMVARRFYALAHGHGDVRVEFTAAGQPMGSRLAAVGDTVSFQVAVSDVAPGNGVAARRIEVVGPGGAVLATAPGMSHGFSAAASAQEQWRFVRVLDAGGKVLAVSAPIWFRN